jgi:hypothetical protein
MRETQEERVRELISKATGAKFEVVTPPADHPLPISDVEWFMRCRVLEDIKKTPYLNSVWKERGGPIWLESLMLGDTFSWIESAYGEEAAVAAIDMNFSDFASKEFQAGFVKDFPLVYRRIQTYQGIAEQTAMKRKAHLELRESGSKGIVVFSLVVKIADKELRLEEKINAGIEALKDAYAVINQV